MFLLIFKLIRSGAFNDKSTIEAMSSFKWRRLYEIVMFQNVLDYFVRGVNNNANDKNLNLPAKLIDEIQAKLDLQDEKQSSRQEDDKIIGDDAELSNKWLNKRYHKIIYNEMHSIDTSTETLSIAFVLKTISCSILNVSVDVSILCISL